MDKLLQELKIGHIAMIEQIDQIHQVIRHYPDVKPKLRELQTILFNHFEKQKQKFYQLLTEYFLSDQEKSKNIQFLEQDIKNLKVKTLIFYDEHPADMGDIRPKAFIRDFQVFSGDLTGRMYDERKYLFPLIEAYPTKKEGKEV